MQIAPNICGLVYFQEIKNEQSIIIPTSSTSLIKLVEYLCPMLSGTKRLLQDELSKDVINEERNFLSDNISLFCWTIKPRRSSRKWLHNAVLPVINTIQNITTIFFFSIRNKEYCINKTKRIEDTKVDCPQRERKTEKINSIKKDIKNAYL